jgi:hypothetical protein
MQEIKDAFKDDKSRLVYLGEVSRPFTTISNLDLKLVITSPTRSLTFAKIQAIKAAFKQCLTMIDKAPETEDTWMKVQDRLREAMATDRNFDPGLAYFENPQERYQKMMEDSRNEKKFITGWQTVDDSIDGGGFIKGEAISIIADSGVGKSVALACMAVRNCLRGFKVCYISTELSEYRIATRIDAIITKSPVTQLVQNKELVFDKLTKVQEDLRQIAKNMIVVKQFPPKSASANTIRAYLTQLKFHGFVPDMVIIDYVGEMKDHSDMKLHDSRQLTVSELRGLAEEGEKFFLATAMQPNRDAKAAQREGGRIEVDHLADSYGQIRPLDCALSFSQNDGEKKLNLGRGFIMKQRNGKAALDFALYFNPDTLEIVEINQQDYRLRMSARSEKAQEEIQIDKVSSVVTSADQYVNIVKDDSVTGYVPSDAKPQPREG